MEGAAELLKQGILGVVAFVFFGLYWQEHKDHKDTLKAKDEIAESYRLYAVNSAEKVTSTMGTITQTIALLTEKIEIAKRGPS